MKDLKFFSSNKYYYCTSNKNKNNYLIINFKLSFLSFYIPFLIF